MMNLTFIIFSLFFVKNIFAIKFVLSKDSAEEAAIIISKEINDVLSSIEKPTLDDLIDESYEYQTCDGEFYKRGKAIRAIRVFQPEHGVKAIVKNALLVDGNVQFDIKITTNLSDDVIESQYVAKPVVGKKTTFSIIGGKDLNC